jgi:hypothetical protein
MSCFASSDCRRRGRTPAAARRRPTAATSAPKGEVRASLNERAAARHLHATILGIKVMSKAGASPERLRDVAVSALEGMARPKAKTKERR